MVSGSSVSQSKQSLRVLFVASGYPSHDCPSQSIFLHRSIKALSASVVPTVLNVRAWLPGRPLTEKMEWEGIPVVTIYCLQIPGGKWSQLNAVFFARFGGPLARRHVLAAQHIHSAEIYPAGFAASRWAKLAGKPCTSQAIGSDVNLFLSRNIAQARGSWCSNIGGVACNSKTIYARLQTLLPALKNLRVIHRGVDASTFTADGPVSGPQSGKPPVRFLYLGGFHSYDAQNPLYNLKGGWTLLEAWRRVEDSVAPSTLLITGPGTNPLRLEKWRASLRRPEAAFVMPAIIPERIPAIMRSSDVVVIPSLAEGLPNVANEAQSCGRPVLGSDAGGIPESVLDGETGRIVARGDVDSLVRGLAWFYSHQVEGRAMGARGRERICSQFSWQRFAERMLELFEDAVEGHYKPREEIPTSSVAKRRLGNA